MWHYQPVYVESTHEGETVRVYSLCEVYLDSDGRLESWTDSQIDPIGNDTVTDLQGTLAFMLADTHRWAPVAHNALKRGMCFERVT
jgi:hypothetical protein